MTLMERSYDQDELKLEQVAGNNQFDRHSESIEGESSFITTIRIEKNPDISIITDDAFAEVGIVTEPDSLLIDQRATTESLGRPVGKKPEEYVADIDNVLVVSGNHFGWQQGVFLVQNAELKLLGNDRDNLSGNFATLCMDNEGSWLLRDISIESGKSNHLDNIKLGMSGAPIVRDGVATDLSELLNEPRIKADLRNIFDFSYGGKVPSVFFQDIRKFSPEEQSGKYNPEAFRRMILGRQAVLSAPIPDNSEARAPYQRLMKTINGDEEHSALGHMVVDDRRGRYRLGVFEPLPEQHMPLVGFGVDDEDKLVIVAVDGRQPDSFGVSIQQLAELMIKAGVKDGILGCGGGDVCVVEKNNGSTKILNSPANTDSDGNRVTRLVPNVVVIPLH